jgi:hypothetical protein
MKPQPQSEQHLSEDAFEAYSLGRLREPECGQFEEHLLVCALCQERLTETDQYARSLRTAAVELRQETRERRLVRAERHRWPVLVAGLIAFAVAIVLPWRSNRMERVQEVDLSVERGAGTRRVIQANAAEHLALNLDLTEVRHAAEYRLEVVNAAGVTVWAGIVKSSGNHLRTELPVALTQGIYWVRLYISSPAPFLLREYGLQVARAASRE